MLGDFSCMRLRSPTITFVSTAKYFQRFKKLKYLQNTTCMSFNQHTTFTGFVLIFMKEMFLVLNILQQFEQVFLCVKPIAVQSLCTLISYMICDKMVTFFSFFFTIFFLCLFDQEKITVKLFFCQFSHSINNKKSFKNFNFYNMASVIYHLKAYLMQIQI